MLNFRRLTRAAAAAGVAALLTTPAHSERPQPKAADTKQPKVVVIEAAQAREWELLVELDLMEDPVTFPHVLRCLAGERGMEIRGYVPNELVRTRALTIAEKVSPMHVANGMVIQPNLDFRRPGKLQLADVQARLSQALGATSNVVMVQLSPNGQVILTGRAVSLDDKVQFGRALRGLQGCSSVRNEMTVVSGPAQVPVVVASTAKPAASMREEPVERPAPPPEISPITRPPQLLRDSKPPATQMPPAPVPPARLPDYLPAVGTPPSTAASGDAGSPVVQASKSAPAARDAAPATRPLQDKAAPSARSATEAKSPSAAYKAPMSAQAQQAVKGRIRKALGSTIKEVDLKFDGKGGVNVIVSGVSKNADHNRIAETVIQVPELQSFDVSLEVRVE